MSSDFGVFKLTYEPPASSTEACLEMTLSSEADLTRMLETYGYFLQASGYVLDGKKVALVSDTDWSDFFYKETVVLGDK